MIAMPAKVDPTAIPATAPVDNPDFWLCDASSFVAETLEASELAALVDEATVNNDDDVVVVVVAPVTRETLK